MKTSQPDAERLPYGVNELSPDVVPLSDKPRRVKCYANNCQQVLHTPTRAGKGDICPDHGIRCHYSSAGATYSYADPAHNITASAKAFKQKIVGHPFKYESHRLGLERSEDALSWNVFKSLQEAGSLARFASQITKENVASSRFSISGESVSATISLSRGIFSSRHGNGSREIYLSVNSGPPHTALDKV